MPTISHHRLQEDTVLDPLAFPHKTISHLISQPQAFRHSKGDTTKTKRNSKTNLSTTEKVRTAHAATTNAPQVSFTLDISLGFIPHMETSSIVLFSYLFLPETFAAAAPAETAGVGSGLSRGLGWGLDVCRLPFSHLHSADTPGLHKYIHIDKKMQVGKYHLNIQYNSQCSVKLVPVLTSKTFSQ